MSKRRQDSFRELVDVPGSDVMTRHISRAGALRAVGEVVYAVRCGDVIKIGHTGDLAKRVNKLKATEVLAFMPGTAEDEKAVHARLVDHLHHGQEWYYPTPDVLAIVNEMRAALGLELLVA